MKHLSCVSAKKPAYAAAAQDIICSVIRIVGNLASSKGGTSQLEDFGSNKCFWADDGDDTTV